MPELVTAADLRERASRRKVKLALDGNELQLLSASLGMMGRYASTNLDRAKEDDAINRWADLCVEVRDLQRKLRVEA